VIDRSDLKIGGSGFVMAAPVLADGRVVSFAVGLFRHDAFFSTTLVPWKRDVLHKSRSAAPGWQGAKRELIGHK
jgi:hypothetical protein